MDREILKQCWFLAGPTASGKSSAGICIAEKIGAEIISLDSMAIYRDMDIGTAKPSVSEQERIPHHQINIISPAEEYSLSKFVIEVERISIEILNRNRIPLFVGGTGLYLRGVLRGVFEGPSADWDFRNTLEEEASQKGNEFVHEKLKKIDLPTSEKFHPNDLRRVIRALEVHHITGIPLSAQQKQDPLTEEERPANLFWLQPPREKLYQKIDQRVLWMFDNGLEDEVQNLLDNYESISRTARQGLGYKEVIDFLEQEGSELTLDFVIDLIQTRTRQFAKRQHTWFRNIVECRPLDLIGTESAEEVSQLYIQQGK